MEGLPSHRRLLSSLTQSLCQPVAPLLPEPGAEPNRRRLLLTLHVLFPSIVLPALDLLDRRLVTRICAVLDRRPEVQPRTHAACRKSDSPSEEDELEGGAWPAPPQSAVHLTNEVPSARLYVVQSLASTLARPRGRDPSSSQRTYAVHLDAWSCSCAGFALEAFAGHAQPTAAVPPFTSRASPSEATRHSPRPLLPESWKAGRMSFGGWSLNGLSSHGEDAPCCKHLLACLLAETCPTDLGNGVEHRLVSRRELAGTMAGID